MELGVHSAVVDPRTALGMAASAGMDFVVLDLWRAGQDPDRSDVVLQEPALPATVWGTRVVVRGAPGAGWAAALGWARHTGLSALILPLPEGDRAAAVALGRALMSRETPGPAVWVELPWSQAGLDQWKVVSALVAHDPDVSPCLRLGRRSPSPAVLEAWRRTVPACIAIAAPPTASTMQDALTYLFSGRTKRAYLEGVDPKGARDAVQGAFQRAWSGVSVADQMMVDHKDQLIDPVQPLRDHIGAAIYQNFEQVGPKYEAYRRAVARALVQRQHLAPVRVVVLGAGRGPLVDATLAASDETGIKVKVTAVEKNPHAAVTLRQRSESAWAGRVRVEETDIRALPKKARFDLAVSELLGGFGDNELSPECLKGMARFLGPGGTSLPASSTSYLAPMQCEFLWSAAARSPAGLDTPTGIHMDRAQLLADYQACFQFRHPEDDPQDDLRRVATLTFVAERDGVVHGFAGTFDAALDAEDVFGNHPRAQVSVAHGWAPIFFPLRLPVRVKKQEKVTVSIWRERDAGRVWYAWAVLSPAVGPVQNARGLAASLAL